MRFVWLSSILLVTACMAEAPKTTAPARETSSVQAPAAPAETVAAAPVAPEAPEAQPAAVPVRVALGSARAAKPKPVDPADIADILLGRKPAPAGTTVARAALPRRSSRRLHSEPAVVELPDAGDEALSDADFQSVVGAWRGVRHCISSDAPKTGAISVVLTIRGDGAVIGSRVESGESPALKKLTPCVERQAKLMRFPTFASSEPITKTAKFIF